MAREAPLACCPGRSSGALQSLRVVGIINKRIFPVVNYAHHNFSSNLCFHDCFCCHCRLPTAGRRRRESTTIKTIIKTQSKKFFNTIPKKKRPDKNGDSGLLNKEVSIPLTLKLRGIVCRFLASNKKPAFWGWKV